MNSSMYDKAVELAHKFIIADTHIDLTWRLSNDKFKAGKKYLDLVVESDSGDFDYVRAKKGGLSAAFLAVFIPANFQNDLQTAKAEAISLIDLIEEIISAHPDKFARGDSPAMIESNFKKGLISLPMALENGAPLISIEDVQYFFNRGIRYVTLTHGKDNHICDSSYDSAQTWNGLSPYGKQVIEEMNRVGMMIDISHISDKTFYQVIDRSSAPVLATHSSCRAFTPNWERNMDDDMITLLGKHDGVIQINFGTDFLDAEISKTRAANRLELDKRLKEANLKDEDEEAKPLIAEFKKEFPDVFSDVTRVVDHMDHAINLSGIDHVGIGSDFDGLGDSLPTGLKDVSQYPNLILELLERGYSEDDIEKICYKNVWRVWNKVAAIAGNK
ncbi:MAG TPA: dipeptidase [Saprospiraceae bacterium]|nr:dipeptidase [Saprospiraceae bacterium]